MGIRGIFLLSFFYLSSALACDCAFQLGGGNIVSMGKLPKESCVSEIKLYLSQSAESCQSSKKLKHACVRKNNSVWNEMEISCQELVEIQTTVSLIEVAILSDEVLEKGSPKIDIECHDEGYAPKTQVYQEQVQVDLGDEQELRKLLEKAYPDENERRHVLDRLKEGDVIELQFPNDNALFGLWDLATGDKASDDIGYTHGIKIKISKTLDQNKGYVGTLEYTSDLYTDFVPVDHTERWVCDDTERGCYKPQFFTEENIARLMFEKIKNEVGVSWDISVGQQELNRNDIDNTVLFSSLRQQEVWHGVLRDIDEGAAADYENTPSGLPNETGYFVEGNIEKEWDITHVSNYRVYGNGAVGARITSIDNASYLTSRTGVGIDWQNSRRDTGVRAEAGVSGRAYDNGQQTASHYISFEVGGETFSTKVRCEKSYSDLPEYLGMHPDISNNLPPNETVCSIGARINY